jgi:hypothetical protein
MSDLVDQIFGGATTDQEFYPGSKRKRREEPKFEFIADPWRENYTIKHFNGKDRKMFTIGAMAQALGVSVPAIRKWIKLGYIPQAPYRLPSNMVVAGEKAAGRRLYTEEIIDATVDVFQRNGILGKTRIVWEKHPRVPIEIVEAWDKIIRNKEQGE